MNDTKALLETGKTLLRGVYFTALGAVSVFLTNLVTNGQIGQTTVVIAGQVIDLTLLITLVIGAIAKLIDRYVNKNQNIHANGIAPGFLQR